MGFKPVQFLLFSIIFSFLNVKQMVQRLRKLHPLVVLRCLVLLILKLYPTRSFFPGLPTLMGPSRN